MTMRVTRFADAPKSYYEIDTRDIIEGALRVDKALQEANIPYEVDGFLAVAMSVAMAVARQQGLVTLGQERFEEALTVNMHKLVDAACELLIKNDFYDYLKGELEEGRKERQTT